MDTKFESVTRSFPVGNTHQTGIGYANSPKIFESVQVAIAIGCSSADQDELVRLAQLRNWPQQTMAIPEHLKHPIPLPKKPVAEEHSPFQRLW